MTQRHNAKQKRERERKRARFSFLHYCQNTEQRGLPKKSCKSICQGRRAQWKSLTPRTGVGRGGGVVRSLGGGRRGVLSGGQRRAVPVPDCPSGKL